MQLHPVVWLLGFPNLPGLCWVGCTAKWWDFVLVNHQIGIACSHRTPSCQPMRHASPPTLCRELRKYQREEHESSISSSINHCQPAKLGACTSSSYLITWNIKLVKVNWVYLGVVNGSTILGFCLCNSHPAQAQSKLRLWYSEALRSIGVRGPIGASRRAVASPATWACRRVPLGLWVVTSVFIPHIKSEWHEVWFHWLIDFGSWTMENLLVINQPSLTN